MERQEVPLTLEQLAPFDLDAFIHNKDLGIMEQGGSHDKALFHPMRKILYQFIFPVRKPDTKRRPNTIWPKRKKFCASLRPSGNGQRGVHDHNPTSSNK